MICYRFSVFKKSCFYVSILYFFQLTLSFRSLQFKNKCRLNSVALFCLKPIERKKNLSVGKKVQKMFFWWFICFCLSNENVFVFRQMSSCFLCFSAFKDSRLLRRRSRYRNRYEIPKRNERRNSPRNLSMSVPDLVNMESFDRISADGESRLSDDHEIEIQETFCHGKQWMNSEEDVMKPKNWNISIGEEQRIADIQLTSEYGTM